MLAAPWQRSEDVQEGNPAALGRNQGRCSCLPAGGQLEGEVSGRGQNGSRGRKENYDDARAGFPASCLWGHVSCPGYLDDLRFSEVI